MKALTLLEKNKSVKERSESYFKSIRRSIFRNHIEKIQDRIDKLVEKNFDLENFSLDTNLNAGLKQMTKEDCEVRFVELINNQYELEMLQLELESKTKIFSEYFGEEVTTEVTTA